MADEYIEREAAIAVLWYNQDECGSAIVSDIEAIPAADVALVRHGKWVKSKMSAWASTQWYECSECGEPTASSYGHPARTNFCSNCGAKMKEWTHDD